MDIKELKQIIKNNNFDHIFFWWSLEGDGNNFLCSSISSYDKTAIQVISGETGYDSYFAKDETGEYFRISFF